MKCLVIPPFFCFFFLFFLLRAVIPFGDTNSRYHHDDFPYVLLAMLKTQIDVQNHKKSSVCGKMDMESHTFQVAEGAVCPEWICRLCKGSPGAPGAPGQPWLQWECWQLHRDAAALHFPPRPGTAAPSVSAQNCLSTAGFP